MLSRGDAEKFSGARRTRGRPPGQKNSRDDIVEAARCEFADQGFDRATMRSIASRAGVDPSTIYHFFSDKQALLGAALEFPVAADIVAGLGPVGDAISSEALLERVLALWEQPEVAQRLTALIRLAATHPDAAESVSGLFESTLAPLLGGGESPDAQLRAALIASQVAGLALTRFVVPLPAIVTASRQELVSAVAPIIDLYLSEDTGADKAR